MATNEIAPNKRSHTIDYLFNDICLLINISLTVAQAEFDFEEAGDIRHETFSELLNYICTAHDWMLNTVRLLDWLENYTKYRWSFNGADKQRLQEFVTNKKNGLKDELTLTRQAPL